MKAGKGHQEEEEEEDEEFGTKKDGAPSGNNSKDGKKSEKANATRSKHSVTEQRRRSKINERFQILRELIPHSDQKRDTASFLLEVIQYVQFLQEKVHKYEGSYQPWNSEPTKLMPWRNSHWRVQNIVGQPQTIKNDSTYPGRFDENSVPVPTSMQPGQQNHPSESNQIRDPQNDLSTKAMSMSMPLHPTLPVPISNDGPFPHALHGPSSDAQSADCPGAADVPNSQDELAIEGGTINFSSVYSQGLLSSLEQALQSTGVDLSQANISVQINFGKRANRGSTPGKDQPVGTFQDGNNSEDLDQAEKRRKI